MSGLMILAIVAAIGFVVFGLQVLSRQIQRSSVDVRRPDPLIDVSNTKSVTVRPAEFHQLVLIISNAVLSDASARSELQPLLDELAAGRPPAPTADTGVKPRSGRGKSKRHQRIERSIADLERRWGVGDD